ncbi:MAG: protein kinase [Acidobacteria bacterium]|nr:protein kinase [Acidobacteriota bacterium]
MNPTADSKFEIIEEHIRGGCSVLFKVRPKQPHPDHPILALKAMLPDESDPSSAQRFYMEYEFLRAYGHPNLIKVFDYFQDWNKQPAYLMEWINGETWESFWKERNPMENRALFLDLLRQIGTVLDYVHRHHIVHRDLKPQNLLITRDNQIKLIDFGIMKVESLTLYTNRNTFMGSAYYVAPECLSGDDVTPAADIFSLGVILYDLLTGTKPFRGHTLAETVYQRLVTQPKPPSQIKDLPTDLDPLFERMLHREPHKRPRSGAEVYNAFEQVFSNMANKAPSVSHEKPIDQVSKEHFLHSHFLESCLEKIMEKPTLCIIGGPSTGKSTVADNLALKLVGDRVVKIDCGPALTQNDFIYLILKQVPIPQKTDMELGPWLQIMGNALPQLSWQVTRYNHPLHDSTIFSAFLHLLKAIQKPVCIVLEDVNEASHSQIEFIKPLVHYAYNQSQPYLKVILTSDRSIRSLSGLCEEAQIPFPDILALSEYLATLFHDCRVPLSVSQGILRESGENLGEFLKVIHKRKMAHSLEVRDGVLFLLESSSSVTKPMHEIRGIPDELIGFSAPQLHHLEWIALSPNGLDLQILKKVTNTDLETLTKTLQMAAQRDLLEFRSAATEGFKWQNDKVRDYLRKSLDAEARQERYALLASTIESESEPYLAYSPPLWLVLSQLFNRANQDIKACTYAMNYARYCFQNGNYEPIRVYLSPFVSLPEVQKNQEFWSMLALAYRDADASQALSFANKAMEIDINVQSLTLNAILQFGTGNIDEAGQLLERALNDPLWDRFDLNTIPELIAILTHFPEVNQTENLVRFLETKLKGRNDLVAQNLLFQTKCEWAWRKPQQFLEILDNRKVDLVGQSAHRLANLEMLASITCFEPSRALTAMQQQVQLELNRKSRSSLYFREKLFILLSFHRFEEIKKLIAEFNGQSQENEELFSCTPLFHYTTEFILKEPRVLEPEAIEQGLANLGTDKSRWQAMLITLMDRNPAAHFYYQNELKPKWPHVSPFVRHQIPRFEVLEAFFSGMETLDEPLVSAINHAQENQLTMECLRLHLLEQVLRKEGRLTEHHSVQLKPGLIESGEANHFAHNLGLFSF